MLLLVAWSLMLSYTLYKIEINWVFHNKKLTVSSFSPFIINNEHLNLISVNMLETTSIRKVLAILIFLFWIWSILNDVNDTNLINYLSLNHLIFTKLWIYHVYFVLFPVLMLVWCYNTTSVTCRSHLSVSIPSLNETSMWIINYLLR